MNTPAAHSPLITGQVSSIDLFLAEASLDPRVRRRPIGESTVEETLTALRAAMELRRRRVLPAAPRRPELPRQVVFVLDEAAYLAGQTRAGKQSPETARLLREILALGRASRIND
ncbi:hypothetical protein [Kitasatospora sp. NPDC056800]|uniref:hypothetical protein n=1 Tax=Kitasatospora sp. NPDC056800 TaxID=3345948 RepID=UPI0036B1AD84